ncbi:MAG: hypothetical protein COA79_11175 [Planctomycetota bacterium]|nr:MAG: hypothetical protein COA79_11175 [Planctomycetota bacterium]
MKNIRFSLIEMMAVIVVILILITLAIPSLKKVRKKARTAICANQLKQLGVLLANYTNDYDGYLPYSNNSLYANPGSSSYKDSREGRLYGNWSGHLIPYFNSSVSGSRGKYYHDKNTNELKKDANVLANDNYGNWRLLNNQFYEGGHGDFKLFICPEATNSFYPNHFIIDSFAPRISGIFQASTVYVTGMPSSYVANGQLFGIKTRQSKRLEDVNKTNYLLLEGVNSSDQCTPTDYRKFFTLDSVYGGNVNNIIGGWGASTQNLSSPPRNMMASYMHDDTTELWLSWRGGLAMSYINRYNKVFNPVAAATYMWDRPEGKSGVLSSNQYPGENWENYELPFTKGKFKVYRYYSEDWQPSFMFGKMNYLGSDLSISNEHLGKMFENARTLGSNTQ